MTALVFSLIRIALLSGSIVCFYLLWRSNRSLRAQLDRATWALRMKANSDLELELALRVIASGDKEAIALLREAADRTREEMRLKYGDQNIAADLVREGRGG